MAKSNSPTKIIYLSIAGSIFLALVKGIAGYYGNSFALIADAIESTTDIFSSLLVAFGITYASRPADANHPYGHGRAEPLLTFIVVGFLLISASLIGWKSIQQIRTPHEIPEKFTLIVLAAVVLVKEISFRVMNARSKETHSGALKADAWHHRSDAITSLAAFIGISVAVIMGKGYEAADDWAALFAVGFIFYNAYKIFRPALGEIMDEHVYDELVARIREIALTVEGIRGTEKCFIRKSGMKYHVDLHASVDGSIPVSEGHRISHTLKDVLRRELPELGHVLIHIEPYA